MKKLVDNIETNGKYRCTDSKWIEATRRKCKCGHTVHFYNTIPYLTCNHCGTLIFRNKKCEYDFKITRLLSR